jgi:glycosyltransferase involved in cell wall biosynthesis
LRVVGHGIDTAQFALPRSPSDRLRVITTGRISATKGINEMLEALDMMHAQNVPFLFSIIGAPATEADKKYAAELQQEIAARPYRDAVRVVFLPHDKIPAALAESDVFLNLSNTGSMDKAVLEAMAAGVAVVTSNEAFKPIVPREFFVFRNDAAQIGEAIIQARDFDMHSLQAYVVNNHGLSALIEKILSFYTHA